MKDGTLQRQTLVKKQKTTEGFHEPGTNQPPHVPGFYPVQHSSTNKTKRMNHKQWMNENTKILADGTYNTSYHVAPQSQLPGCKEPDDFETLTHL